MTYPSLTIPQSVPTSQESDLPLTDQALEERVEQILQELTDLLEAHGYTYWDGWEATEYERHFFGPHVKPPQYSAFYPRLCEAQESLFHFHEDVRRLPMLHLILEWYMKYSKQVLPQ